MKIIIKFNNAVYFNNNKEELKRLIDREDFNKKLKTAIDNEKGLRVVNTFGRWCYTIKVIKGKSKKK